MLTRSSEKQNYFISTIYNTYGFPFREPPKGLHTEMGDYLTTDSTLLLRLLDYKGFYYTGGSTTLLLSSEVADELSALDARLLVLCADASI